MKMNHVLGTLLVIGLLFSSCVSNKKYLAVQAEMQRFQDQCNEKLSQMEAIERERTQLKADAGVMQNTINLRQEQIDDLKKQLEDLKAQRDKQLSQVGDLTVLSQSANENIRETLSQLEKKDKYIQLLQAAKSKADSINLALAVNLKGSLKEGIEDKDVDIKVDKTVVYINLSDKMLYQSGSATLTPRAQEVLGKIALIIKDRPELDVMVEGYTDSQPIKTDCLADNWDLSVKRATSVVRVLQTKFEINPDKLIAAGRGQYNALASNDTAEGRSINRRTRIIILPRLNQFYDLLNPNLAATNTQEGQD